MYAIVRRSLGDQYAGAKHLQHSNTVYRCCGGFEPAQRAKLHDWAVVAAGAGASAKRTCAVALSRRLRCAHWPRPGVSFGVGNLLTTRPVVCCARERTQNMTKMVPLYAARIEDLGSGDFVKVDCAACGHTALLTPAFLSRLGLSPLRRVLDLQDRVRCRACGLRSRAVVSIKWAKSVA
jgi:hypothetical protein